MKTFCLFLLLFFLFTENNKTFSQDSNEMTFISFELTHSLRIPNHHVVINIVNRNKQQSVHLITNPLTKIKNKVYKAQDTVFAINVDEFEALSNAVLKLNDMNVAKAELSGKDGTTCNIEFSSADKTVKYEFWSPDYETEQRGLTDFLNACKQIIEAAHLRPKDVL